MKNKIIAILFATLFTLPLVVVMLPDTPAQMSDTCADGQMVVLDATNKRYKCLTASTTYVYRAKSVNLNGGANSDVATITGLPSKYIVRRITFDSATGTPTLSTIDVRTAASGGGTAIVAAQALATLNGSTKYLDATLAVTTTVLTASSLTIRNVAAAGGAMTVDVSVEVTPLL